MSVFLKISFSLNDFVLRQIDFGGGPNALGQDLEVNGTVTVDWVQQLPDNFEGDYYLLIADQSQIGSPYYVSETPEVSIRSFNKGDISLISDDSIPYEFMPENFELSSTNSRPSTNLNGDIVAFEALYNGVNQIFVKIISTNELILVSRPFDYTVQNDIAPNDSSYAPKISADGRFVVFHSRASNLVPDDLNNHSDIFIYDLESLNSVASGLNTENVNIGKLTKISNSATGEGGNGEVFILQFPRMENLLFLSLRQLILMRMLHPLEADKYSSLIIIWVLDWEQLGKLLMEML